MRKLWMIMFAALLLAGCSSAPPAPVGQQQAADDLVPMQASATYPLKTCVVSNEKLGSDRLAFSYKGREVEFCCADCVDKFKKNPDKYLAKLPAAK